MAGAGEAAWGGPERTLALPRPTLVLATRGNARTIAGPSGPPGRDARGSLDVDLTLRIEIARGEHGDRAPEATSITRRVMTLVERLTGASRPRSPGAWWSGPSPRRLLAARRDEGRGSPVGPAVAAGPSEHGATRVRGGRGGPDAGAHTSRPCRAEGHAACAGGAGRRPARREAGEPAAHTAARTGATGTRRRPRPSRRPSWSGSPTASSASLTGGSWPGERRGLGPT